MEYFVRFSNGNEAMVPFSFGPMKKLIKAYEKGLAKQNPSDDDGADTTAATFATKDEVKSAVPILFLFSIVM